MTHIIVISGKQYSGKDTLAKILLEKLEGYRRIGIGDAMKIEYAKRKNITFDEIVQNKHLYRNDLIELGNWGRAIDEDYWLKNLADMDKIIVPDIRMPHEVEFFRKKGAFLIRVNSTYENRIKRGIVVNPDDLTETSLDNYSYWNVVVSNDFDLKYLVSQADIVLKKFNQFLAV